MLTSAAHGHVKRQQLHKYRDNIYIYVFIFYMMEYMMANSN